MASLTFTLDGDLSDLDWLRSRIHGAILEIVDEQVEDGRIAEDTVEVSWEFGD